MNVIGKLTTNKERSSDIFVEKEHGRNSKGRSPDILDNT
jgi:hypothetical protein